ncbi:MAG: hypothetical protein L3J79_06825 [Candidatus Marinimicrobia bacterium]|nr:hypothetical protein [Candidatus Neomarinimicrobiota bacterium]
MFQTGLIITCFLVSTGLAQDSTAVDSSAAKSAGQALLYSIVPGGGQLYNQRPLKALLFSGVFAYYAYEYSRAQQDFQVNPADQTLHRMRNDKVWLMALTWTLNILDAYVDSQLWDFDKYELNVDELPETDLIKPKETEKPNDTE